MNKEMWRPIRDFKNYQVSNHGRVRSCYSNLILRGDFCTKYHRVELYKNKVGYLRRVHRLVLEAFVEKARGRQCNHIDFNKLNNHVDNLEWVTTQENTRYNVLHKRHIHGVMHGCSKLSEKQVLEIRKKHLPGKNTTELAKEYGVSRSHILNIVRRKTWKHL